MAVTFATTATFNVNVNMAICQYVNMSACQPVNMSMSLSLSRSLSLSLSLLCNLQILQKENALFNYFGKKYTKSAEMNNALQLFTVIIIVLIQNVDNSINVSKNNISGIARTSGRRWRNRKARCHGMQN